MNNAAHDNLGLPKGTVIVELRDAKTGRLKSRDTYENLFVTTGRRAVADALRGNVTSNRGQITYCSVGTGTNVPAAADTTLQTELYRKLVSVRSVSTNTAIFKTFFNQTEANGVLREAGLFGDDASDTANSGTLFARVNINRTKTTSDTLTITWMVTV